MINNYTKIEANINSTNFSNSYCNLEDYDTTFYKCYNFFFRKKLIENTLQILLFFMCLINNTKKREIKNVFDHIIICNCLVALLNSGFDLPIYHVLTSFKYWPFGEMTCLLWSSLSTATNVIDFCHMIYLLIARLLSITKPVKFRSYFIIKHPFLVSFIIWILSFIMWVPIILVFLQTLPKCEIIFKPQFLVIILNTINFIIPLFIITILTILIIKSLNDRKNIKCVKLDSIQLKYNSATTLTSLNQKKNFKKRNKHSKNFYMFIKFQIPF